jgi:septal ring factor EnvC (AmiA/AmiB activator)
MRNGKIAVVTVVIAGASSFAALGGYWLKAREDLRQQGANERIIHEIDQKSKLYEKDLQETRISVESLKGHISTLVESQKATNDRLEDTNRHIDDLVNILKDHYKRPH